MKYVLNNASVFLSIQWKSKESSVLDPIDLHCLNKKKRLKKYIFYVQKKKEVIQIWKDKRVRNDDGMFVFFVKLPLLYLIFINGYDYLLKRETETSCYGAIFVSHVQSHI